MKEQKLSSLLYTITADFSTIKIGSAPREKPLTAPRRIL